MSTKACRVAPVAIGPCGMSPQGVLAPGEMRKTQTSGYPPDASGGKEEEAAMRSKQEEALLRRARRLIDLGDQLKSIREEVEQIAFDIYDEVGEDRKSRRDLEGHGKGGGGLAED
jgi:hypothetical protein